VKCEANAKAKAKPSTSESVNRWPFNNEAFHTTPKLKEPFGRRVREEKPRPCVAYGTSAPRASRPW